jgi:hypothetical protein
MATISVTDHGVTLNDPGESVSNHEAIDSILHSEASDGDTILFPFEQGDVLWISSAQPNTGGGRAIEPDVARGLPQNLTFTGNVGGDSEPQGKIMLPGSLGGWHYLMEVRTRSGLDAEFKNLHFDHNTREHSEGGSTVLTAEQSPGGKNDILFFNCVFEGGNDVNFRAKTNGVHHRYCTSARSETFHAFTWTHREIDTVEPRCTMRNCLALRPNRLSFNHSHGHVIIENSVGLGGGSKWGTDPPGQTGLDVEYHNVRLVDGNMNKGIFSLEDETPLNARFTLDNVVIDGFPDEGIRAQSSTGEFFVPEGSKLLVLNNGREGILFARSDTLTCNGELHVCGNAEGGIDYWRGTDGFIETLVTNGNGGGPVANTGDLQINTHRENTACDTDIEGVPHQEDVGAGTMPSLSPSFTVSPENPLPGQEVVFEADGRDGVEYSWAFGNGATATGQTVSHSYSGPGEYRVVLTASHPDIGESKVARTVNVTERSSGGSGAIALALGLLATREVLRRLDG